MSTTLVGISGSLRHRSLNTALLRSASQLAPPHVRVELGTIRGIPLFDQDVEDRDGVPEAVVLLKEQIARASGLLLVTPEYNLGIPGVMKNAIDWLTRPFQDVRRIFGGRPVALLSASATPSGGASALAAWLPILKAFGARTFDRHLSVPKAFQVFDENGALIDDQLAGRLREFMSAFADFTELRK